ncbi:UNVERIFIED_CONTAM: hypothetical protein Sindi_0967000 [Sesamum indicum]
MRSTAQTDRAAAFEAGKEQGIAKGREHGIAEGRALFLQSQEFLEILNQARLNGARDFLRSRTFREVVENQASDFMVEGFENYQGQMQKLDGFVEGFDQEQLDVSLDKHLEPYPPGPAPADDFPEFLPLMDDLPPPFPIS